MGGSDEYHVQTTPTQTTDIPAQFTGCHSHDGKLYVDSYLPKQGLKLTRFCLVFVLDLMARM